MNTPQKRKTRDGAILCLVGIPAPTRRPLKEHREPISSPRFGPQGQPHPRRSAPAPRKSGGGITDCPRSRDRDRRHAAQRLAAISGAGGHDFRAGWRGRRARRAVRPKPSACRSSRLARAGARRQSARPRRRLARPAAPQPPPPAPLSLTAYQQAPTFGVTGLAARPGRPRAASRRPLLRPWPPCHGSRTVHPQPVREAWSTGAGRWLERSAGGSGTG